ncbi:PTS sugar transporter subunit IIA [Paenibacillus cisolokensis]|jgi:Mannitol/fructose-specific phosphotransferase system, IIA domain|uniref:Mannitol-specific phosphotransferase enzyme IIA component n=1 Tax=Paenibacillus cisolokensis TaxID=1658519 RepID=A0ABQ4N6V6_9BACL|nr:MULTISPECIES: PTS sugar transporter subunit IIA [Paenibacillus]ALS25871.1 subunit EIIA of PTS mannitol transporter [Paenibacillus sp. 32O-W]GIQ63914.1 mannitol-specific phosphotransferase enzyme IIA component [Paenibacillus cisolokensis]
MSILSKEKVKLNVKVQDKVEAIRLAGQLLVDAGHVPAAYIDKMIERENVSSTYVGGGLAMPHGTNDAKELIRSTGMSVLVVPDGVEFGGETAYLVIGLAAVGDEHLEILSGVAAIVSEEDDMKRILQSASEEEVIAIFEEGMSA